VISAICLDELKKYALFIIFFVLMGVIFLLFFMNACGRDMMILGVVMFAAFIGVAVGTLFAANRIYKFIPF
jgi:hypothetical protein